MSLEMVPDNCTTPVARKRREWRKSLPNPVSVKRRKLSYASPEKSRDAFLPTSETTPTVQGLSARGDRFIPRRKSFTLPLSASPRTTRMANVFGLADDRVLSFNDPGPSSPDAATFQSLRKSAFQLFQQPPAIPTTSALSNLATNKQFNLALDAPGVPADPLAYPLAWSSTNKIAVACGNEIYYQDLTSRNVNRLCATVSPIRVIQWATQDPEALALGGYDATVQLWDAATCTLTRSWDDLKRQSVHAMSWHGEVLAVGERPGSVSLYDVRMPAAIAKLGGHKYPVHGLAWSPTGRHLASSDGAGGLQVWDAVACKSLGQGVKSGGKFRHNGIVKALAWCPWKPELLATGTFSPDGKIRIWNTSSIPKSPEPIHTIPLRTSVTSLHWSPHCKELLSTHGDSWVEYLPADAPTSTPPRLRRTLTSQTNSITVHSYPNYNRLVSVPAHTGPVGHSCLSPDGTSIFTLCPSEEAMKMWKVWGVFDPTDSEAASGSVLDGSKLVIR